MNLKLFDITDRCTACGACISICPTNALVLTEQKKIGFYYPTIDESKCIECHQCEKTCHILNPVNQQNSERHLYMLKANDKELLKRSSSGGAFSILAEQVLNNGGIVYGASYNYETERLEETSTEKVDIDCLRKSKYIESYCGNIFKDIENKIGDGKHVFFCGTPCQIKGLYHYLKQKRCNTDNITLVQFICHGVPSNRYFTEYKHHLEKKHKSKIVHIDFRNKKYGWHAPFYMKFRYRNSHSIVFRSDASIYMASFYKYYMLRNSCYGCTICDEGVADITIADFWGLKKYKPNSKETEGISLVIAHNKKADCIINSIKDAASIEKLPTSVTEHKGKLHSDMVEILELRKKMETLIMEQGYIPYFESILKQSIIKARIKNTITKVLFALHIWKTNE